MNVSKLIAEFAGLRQLFDDPVRCPVGPDLIHYLAQPRAHSTQFDYATAYRELRGRTHEDDMSPLGYAPTDYTVFKARYRHLANNNTAYRIACKRNPTVPELEKFASTRPQWAILWPVKVYLQHHMALAREYRGMLPFGSEVIRFLNERMGMELPVTPSATDHVMLRDLSNGMAEALGIPTVVVNDVMYILGRDS